METGRGYGPDCRLERTEKMSENGGAQGGNQPDNKGKRGGAVRRGGTAVGAGAIILLLLGLGGGGLGLGSGLGGLIPGNGPEESNTAAVSQPQEEEQQEAEVTEEAVSVVSAVSEETKAAEVSQILIEVSEEKILVNGEEMADTEALKEYLLAQYTEGTVITLKDDHAIKASYDEVRGVLDELEYEYTAE